MGEIFADWNNFVSFRQDRNCEYLRRQRHLHLVICNRRQPVATLEVKINTLTFGKYKDLGGISVADPWTNYPPCS